MRALMLWVCMSASVLAADRTNDPAPVYDMAPGEYVLSVRARPGADVESIEHDPCRLYIDKTGWRLTLPDLGVTFSGTPGLRRSVFKSENLTDAMLIRGLHTGPDELSGTLACEGELISSFIIARTPKEPRELTESEMVLYILQIAGRKP